MSQPSAARRPVELVAAPLDVLLGLNAWLAGLLDALGSLGAEPDATSQAAPSDRLRELGEALQSLIERPRGIMAEQVAAAAQDGVTAADLHVAFSRDAVPRIGRTMMILDEIDELSRSGALAYPPRSDEQIAVLQWLGREAIGQLEIGRKPRPFRRTV